MHDNIEQAFKENLHKQGTLIESNNISTFITELLTVNLKTNLSFQFL